MRSMGTKIKLEMTKEHFLRLSSDLMGKVIDVCGRHGSEQIKDSSFYYKIERHALARDSLSLSLNKLLQVSHYSNKLQAISFSPFLLSRNEVSHHRLRTLQFVQSSPGPSPSLSLSLSLSGIQEGNDDNGGCWFN